MKLSNDDPRLTAWLLGELSPGEAAGVAKAVEDSKELQETVTILRATLSLLEEALELPEEGTGALSAEHRAAVLQGPPGPRFNIFRAATALAAMLAVAIGIHWWTQNPAPPTVQDEATFAVDAMPQSLPEEEAPAARSAAPALTPATGIAAELAEPVDSSKPAGRRELAKAKKDQSLLTDAEADAFSGLDLDDAMLQGKLERRGNIAANGVESAAVSADAREQIGFTFKEKKAEAVELLTIDLRTYGFSEAGSVEIQGLPVGSRVLPGPATSPLVYIALEPNLLSGPIRIGISDGIRTVTLRLPGGEEGL